MSAQRKARPGAIPGVTKKAGKGKGSADPALRAASATARWIAADPLTRTPAVALVTLYAAGLLAEGSDPVVWSVLGGCATAVTYATGRRSGGPAWARTTGGIMAAATGWMTLSAYSGDVLTRPVSLGYTVAATAAWLWWMSSDRISTRRAWGKAQVEWSKYAEAVGLEGAKLDRSNETRLGFALRVDIRSTKKTADEWASKALRSRIAGKHALPVGRVAVIADPGHAGMLLITVRLVDPWANPIIHPLLAPEVDVDEWRRGRTIAEPIIVGEDPETEREIEVSLFDETGGRHWVIVAGSRGGKTTLLNSLVEHITDTPDGCLRLIDVTKAKDGRVWAPLCAATALGPDEVPKAVQILRDAKTRVAARAKASTTAVHVPSSREPVNVTIIDEASELLGRKDAWGDEARGLVSYLMSKGLSEGEILVIAAQRGVLSHLGTGDVKANSFGRILLGVANRAEMGHVIPDWETRGMPDMSQYGDGRKGVVLVDDGAGWVTGRAYDLSDLAVLRSIVAERSATATPAALLPATPGRVTATADPATADPAGRPVTATPAPADRPVTATRPVPATAADPADPDLVPGAPWATAAPAGPLWRPTTADPATPAEAAAVSAYRVAEYARAEIAGVGPAEAENRWAVRTEAVRAADLGRRVPDAVLLGTLEVLTERGMSGASRAEIEGTVRLGKAMTAEWLRVMVAQGKIARHGTGRQTIYTLPTVLSGGPQS